MKDVEGKVAFITGGANGIGLGIARAFVDAGMYVVIADIRDDALDEAAAEFEAAGKGDRVETVHLDVTDRESMKASADAAEEAFGKVHVLVNNAGIGIGGPLKDARYDDWDWGMDVNLGGVINGIVEFLPRLLAHGEGGHIINTSSMAFCPGPVQTNIKYSGELRPDKYRKDSGYAEVEKQLSERPNSPNWMTIDEVGERVLTGLRNNDLFIFTHREFKDGLAERCKKMLDSFPDEEINKKRYEEIKWLTENPIYK
jgi:NAD(P)-dependent dehydrogenase (short-subunit alcohol dehydrogenase family)